MNPKTWQDYRAEVPREDRRERLQWLRFHWQ